MIFNMAQKYASVFAAFVNTVLIVTFLDVSFLGLYAFLTASATIFAVVLPIGLRSVYLREIVKDRDDIQGQRNFTVLAEIVPKLTAIVFSAALVGIAQLFELPLIDTLSICVMGIMLASAQLSSQKLRSHGLNSLSQIVINSRPILFTLLLLSAALIGTPFLETHFRTTIILSFVLSALPAYAFWVFRFRDLVLSKVDASAVIGRMRTIAVELPGLFMLALGQRAIAQTDVIMVAALLNLDAAGIYRVCTQIVTVANSSMFPLQSHYQRAYSKRLEQNDMVGAKQIERRVARSGAALYLVFLVAAVTIVYQTAFIEDVKHSEDFMWSLGILALVGLVRASIPMVDNYVVYRNKSNLGGLILMVVVLANLVMHAALIPLIGLPGACVTALLSLLIWRVTVRRFL